MQQSVIPIPHPIQSELTLPGAKSITQRALVLAALAEGVSEISAMHIDDDIRTLITALYQFGIVVQCDENTNSCIVAGCNGVFPQKQASIWCGNNDLAARLLIAASAVSPGVYYFDGSPEMRAKPVAQLFQILRRQGVQFIPSETRKLPCTIISAEKMDGGDIILEGQMINQITSALLIIAPYARSPFNFYLGETQFHPKVDLTCMMMAEFGVLVHRIHQSQYMVPVPQKYQAKDYRIEPDFSLASYLCGALLITGGELTLHNIKRAQSKQSTNKFFIILEKFGCRIFETEQGTTITAPDSYAGIDIGLREFSDTFLILAVVAVYARTSTRITHLGRMKQREINRLIEIKSELTKCGIKVTAGKNWVEIAPGTPKAGTFTVKTDYRVGMAAALLGLKTPNIVIENVEAILDIYPNYFDYLEELAARTKVRM